MIEIIRSDDNLVGEALSLLLLLLPLALAVWGMRRGYRTRRAQADERYGAPPFVDVPDRQPDAQVLYTGTTEGGSRMARVALEGLFGRGSAGVWLTSDGVVVQRYGGPAVALRGIREVGRTGAHAGRVAGKGRIAVIGWTLGEQPVDTGLLFPGSEEAATFVKTVSEAAAVPVVGEKETT